MLVCFTQELNTGDSWSIMVSKYLTLGLCFLMGSATFADTSAPELGVKDTQGKTWTLKKLEKDKIYFIEFWATWCSTCKQIAPIIESFVADNRGDEFEFLSVSVDSDKNALLDYLKSKKPKYPVLLDSDFEMAKRWDANEIPKMFLVKNGKVIWSKIGKVNRKELDEALQKTASLSPLLHK